jgi:hypothetical protein
MLKISFYSNDFSNKKKSNINKQIAKINFFSFLLTCLVRFVDLGIVKSLDRQTELREIDQKFFNCPLKALHCSINLDKEVFSPEACMYQNQELKQFKFSKQARKYFTKIIYKRVLYAKVVNFTYECVESDQFDLSLTSETSAKHSICQIILGAQFQRGIVDIFMYLLSKFDRSHYTVLKQYHNQQQQLVKEGVVHETDAESSHLDSQTCTQTNTCHTNTQSARHGGEEDVSCGDLKQDEVSSFFTV